MINITTYHCIFHVFVNYSEKYNIEQIFSHL